MTMVTFWEKPGCRNNTLQKAMLRAAGHQVDARSLLTEPWTAEALRPFFGAKPVAEWFNRASPRVKDGEIKPETMDEAGALAAMTADPLLIRRPLMQVGEDRRSGFDAAQVDAWIGLTEQAATVGDVESCPKTHDRTPCPTPAEH